jgi:hypothetical protein
MEKSDDAVAAARKYLVERRSTLIRSLGFAQQSELMETHIDLPVRLRGVIDVIDRVAREEALVQ